MQAAPVLHIHIYGKVRHSSEDIDLIHAIINDIVFHLNEEHAELFRLCVHGATYKVF